MQIIDNIPCYAPDLAYANSGFPPVALDKLFKIEERNFWYQSRNEIIITIAQRYLKMPSSILEVGCGNGIVLQALSQIKGFHLMGAEVYLSGILNAKQRLPGVEFIQMDALNIPFNDKFDAIGCFDVLEHMDEDEEALKQFHKAIKEGGKILLTVPQYKWLWSDIDNIDKHKRRYSLKELSGKIRSAGFEIIYLGSFAFTVFPLLLISRLIRKRILNSPAPHTSALTAYPEIEISSVLNYLLRQLMRPDEWLIRIGCALPFGGSLVAVAKKN